MENKTYLFGDVLVGIFSNLPDGKNAYKMTMGDIGVKEFFYKNKDKYGVIKNNFTYDLDGTFISSKTVDETLDSLRATRTLLSDMDFKIEKINSSLKYMWNKFRKDKFKPEEIKEIKDLSRKFAEEFCA